MCVQLVLREEVAPLEVIIVEDGSTTAPLWRRRRRSLCCRDAGSAPTASAAVAWLSAGSQTTLSNSFGTADVAVCTHTPYIRADNLSMVAKSDETNHIRSLTFNVTALLGG